MLLKMRLWPKFSETFYEGEVGLVFLTVGTSKHKSSWSQLPGDRSLCLKAYLEKQNWLLPSHSHTHLISTPPRLVCSSQRDQLSDWGGGGGETIPVKETPKHPATNIQTRRSHQNFIRKETGPQDKQNRNGWKMQTG